MNDPRSAFLFDAFQKSELIDPAVHQKPMRDQSEVHGYSELGVRSQGYCLGHALCRAGKDDDFRRSSGGE